MAGKDFAGTIDVPKDSILARAYCEGRKASFDGALENTNPHPEVDSEAFIAWDLGWKSYVTGGSTPGLQDNCDIAPLAI